MIGEYSSQTYKFIVTIKQTVKKGNLAADKTNFY